MDSTTIPGEHSFEMDFAPTEIWLNPERFPELHPSEAHVWRFGLEPPATELAELESTLDDRELRRADSFRGKGLRSKFVAGRGMLRRLLGGYLGEAPSRIAFTYGANGKPELASDRTEFRFNLAHTGSLALLAVTKAGAVGVDVEALRPFENAERIIERFFSKAEQKAFLDLPESERFTAFYLGWTRKEAYLKAVGTGLATRLDSFDVSLTPGLPAALLRVEDDPDAHKHWEMFDLNPGEGFAGALVVASSRESQGPREIRRFVPFSGAETWDSGKIDRHQSPR